MPSHVTSLLADVERERKALNRERGSQLNSSKLRDGLRALVEQYFNDVRPMIDERSAPVEHIQGVDSAMQDLLALCHKRGSVQKYKSLLKVVKAHLIHLDTGLVTGGSQSDIGIQTELDSRIIKTLRALLPSAALSYEQAIADLSAPDRLSWRGPATDLREALRETLDHLAADRDVERSPGYKQAANTNGPTMKQKVRYIMKNRGQSKAISAPAEDATAAIDDAVGSFVRSVYTRTSVSTHTPTDKNEVLRVLEMVRVVLSELLEAR
ncbi:MAG: hypothetical protein M5U09_28275 [Gammaproteobacteria bacterium]|nr:hypothetical protein [Gammaproteobacteria bacterium]